MTSVCESANDTPAISRTTRISVGCFAGAGAAMAPGGYSGACGGHRPRAPHSGGGAEPRPDGVAAPVRRVARAVLAHVGVEVPVVEEVRGRVSAGLEEPLRALGGDVELR